MPVMFDWFIRRLFRNDVRSPKPLVSGICSACVIYLFAVTPCGAEACRRDQVMIAEHGMTRDRSKQLTFKHNPQRECKVRSDQNTVRMLECRTDLL